MKKIALIVAGGIGTRMGASMPKQFILLNNKPIIVRTIEAFIAAFPDIEIVIVLPENHLQPGINLIASFIPHHAINYTVGGDTRFHSVKNGLAFVKDHSIVFVHDAVRCLVTPHLIQNCYHQAVEKGSAIPAVAATDSIRIAAEDTSSVIDRNNVRLVQTPQTFDSTILHKAFIQNYQESFTDEASVVEEMGNDVYLIEGEYDNIKITRPIDLILAKQIIEERIS